MLTMKEISKLKETEELFNSNLYRVQINELLSEVSISTKVKFQVNKWFEEFSSFLNTLAQSESYSLGEFKAWLGSSKLPLPEKIHPLKLTKGTFQWSKPSSVELAGSWNYDAALNKMSPVKVVVVMPKTFLMKRDYLNHTYHVKRAMYLTYLAIQLENRGDSIKFSLEGGNRLKPVLKVSQKHFNVIIHAVPSSDFCKISRFLPEVNNLRFEHFFGNPFPSDEPEYSTPNYNFSVVNDILLPAEQLTPKRILGKSTNFIDALKLLKVWLIQRSLNRNYGGFSSHIMTMFMCYLASKNKINGMMSSYQIIRIVFNNLVNMDWTTTGISFNSDSTLSDWITHFDVVFLDESGHMNYTSNMSKLTYRRIQFEAKLALVTLDGANVSAFQALFISKPQFLLNFDHILQFKKVSPLEAKFKSLQKCDREFLNHSDYFYPIGTSAVGEIIEKALGNRLQLIDIELPATTEWCTNELPPNSSEEVLRFGLIINREAAFRQVEKCESEDPIIVSQFKDFWGEKSDYRRFKDGSMYETVVFDDNEMRSRVCFQMIQYSLEKHLNFKLKNFGLYYLDGQLERTIDPGYVMIKLDGIPKNNFGTPNNKKALKGYRPPKEAILADLEQEYPMALDEIANLASKSFDELSTTLRQLNGLPLAITSVQGTSSILRFLNVFPTPPQKFYSSTLLTQVNSDAQCSTIKCSSSEIPLAKCPKYVEPIGVMVHLESSGKWPDDIKAIERLKCAFLLRIGQLLREQFGMVTQVYSRHVDVLKDGFVFRIRLTYFREIILLKQLQGDDGLLKIRDNPQSLLLEKEALILPQVTSTLHSLHRQFEAYGKTCRLAKRWISSQLLLASPLQFCRSFDEPDCRFTEESIELIVAHLFLSFAPYLSPPNEAQTGFLRFLSLLSTTDWNSTPLVVNFNAKLNKDQISKIERIFTSKRITFPTLFITTPEDQFGSVWTKNLQPIVIQRAAFLAEQALSVMSNIFRQCQLNTESSLDNNLKGIFRPTMKQFDVLIWIKRELDPRKTQSIDHSTGNAVRFKQYIKSKEELMPIVDFDPIQLFLQDLREAFGHLALFLHDLYGGSCIAVVWKQDALKPQPFKISNVKGRVLSDKDNVVGEIDGILECFRLIGKDIVDRIETKDDV